MVKLLVKRLEKKMSEAHKGENNPNYGKTFSEEHRKKIGKAMKGKTLSEKTKQKISEATKGENNPMYGKEHTEESKQKMSETKKGKNNPRATKVYCVELDMVFNTITEASKFVGCDQSNISNVLIGRQKTAGGYHWIYAEDRNNK